MSKFKSGDKVRIVKCSEPTYWYAGEVSKIFTIKAEQFLKSGQDVWYPITYDDRGRLYLHANDIELVTEEEMNKEAIKEKLKNTYWKVTSDEECYKVQKWLFDLGYEWSRNGQNQAHYIGYVYIKDSGILYSSVPMEFRAEYKEIKLKQKVIFEIEEVEQRPTIELNGKKYYKDELEKALQSLEEAKEV